MPIHLPYDIVITSLLKEAINVSWPKIKQTSEYYQGSPTFQKILLDWAGKIRQNHAMEHATITLLLKNLENKAHLLGYASPGGFHILGDVPTDVIEQSVNEALKQFKKGKENLAVSPMCGTNLVVAGLVASAASMVAGRGHRGWSRFSRMATASIFAAIAAQPLGQLAQKYITTNSDQYNVTSIHVTKKGIGKFTVHHVEILRS